MSASAPLMPALLSRASWISFYRFCQLLELIHPQRPPLASQEYVSADPVRFRVRSGLGFPSTEMRYQAGRIEDEHLPVPAVLAAFLGLIGVDGVLPHHIGTDLATRREGHETLADFLDIFHHRIISRYYAIWRKYHYPAGFQAGGRDQISRSLLGLAGRALEEGQGNWAAARWLALLGPMSRRTRSADGMRAVVLHAIPDVGVSVGEFYHRPVLLEAGTLGRNTRMTGGSSILGRRIADTRRTVKLTLELDSSEQLASLQPGHPVRADLRQVLRGYLGTRWDVALFASLSCTQLPAARTARQGVRLGREACLGQAFRSGHPAQRMTLPLGTLFA